MKKLNINIIFLVSFLSAITLTFICMVILTHKTNNVYIEQSDLAITSLNNEQNTIDERDTTTQFTPLVHPSSQFLLSDGKIIDSDIDYNSWDNSNKLRFKINTTIQNIEYTFNFVRRTTESFDLLLQLPTELYVLDPIPQTETYIMSLYDNLYLLDPAKLSITPFLKDNIYGISYHDVLNEHIPDFSLSWATSPMVSPDGKKVIFHSTRNVLIDGDTSGQLWVKYLDGTDEYPFVNTGGGMIGFTKNEEIIYMESDTLKIVNILSGQSEILVDFALSPSISVGDPYIFYKDESSQMTLLNYVNDDAQALDLFNIGNVHRSHFSPSAEYIVMVNRPDPKKHEREIIVYSIDTKQNKRLSIENNFDIGWINMISDEAFSIELIEQFHKPVTYLFEYSKLFNE